MKELKFRCLREMVGDREYKTGDTRKLTAIDAIGLVRSGALEPADTEAKDAVKALLEREPEVRYGVQAVEHIDESEGKVTKRKGDAPKNKAMGNAPDNKGDQGQGDQGQGGEGGQGGQEGGEGGQGGAGTPPAGDGAATPPAGQGAATPPAQGATPPKKRR